MARRFNIIKQPAFVVIIRCCWTRGPDQAGALAELKRRRLWLSDDQKRMAGLTHG